ncbi:MAG: Efflux pump periplasmic linker BepF, partial [Planctomycetota bacterium]
MKLIPSSSLVVCSLLVVTACRQERPSPPPPGPAAVTWVELQPQTIDLTSRSVAQTRANERVEIRSRVAGELVAIGFASGDAVKKDQVLFQLDRRPYEAAVAA